MKNRNFKQDDSSGLAGNEGNPSMPGAVAPRPDAPSVPFAITGKVGEEYGFGCKIEDHSGRHDDGLFYFMRSHDWNERER